MLGSSYIELARNLILLHFKGNRSGWWVNLRSWPIQANWFTLKTLMIDVNTEQLVLLVFGWRTTAIKVQDGRVDNEFANEIAGEKKNKIKKSERVFRKFWTSSWDVKMTTCSLFLYLSAKFVDWCLEDNWDRYQISYKLRWLSSINHFPTLFFDDILF